ncbi:ABC transporter permease [soil metagenome]
MLAQGRADRPTNVVEFLFDADRWTAEGGILDQAWITAQHSLAALAVAVAVAIPVAVLLAHYRRAELLASWLVNIGRAIPTVAIVGIMVIVSLRQGWGFTPWPIVLALVLLALPPLFTNTYTAVRGVDPGAVSSARAMGLRERGVMFRVELPLALPIALTGLRTAAVQILATEPLGAFFGGEGLGAYVRQGLANDNLVQVQAGAVLVTGLAILTDVGLFGLTRLLIPRGVRRSTVPTDRRRPVTDLDPVLDTVPSP